MPLAPSSRLGHYEVLGPLGAGGMGEVFRARDTRLDREVALKVLKGGQGDEAGWVGRFEREARLLASLNHPNIAILHGRDEADGVRFLVMELVPGETLSARLASRRLPLSEALEVCRQIALALEAAHEKGIIHRDLKPRNVMITPDDQVKVLDFGLAVSAPVVTAAAPVDSGTTQAHQRYTAEGMIVGTPAYMSPEQARGKPIDKRTDVWAFGCVLFEALSGRPSFGGETCSDTLAAVLERTPNWEALPPQTPRRLVELVRRCLQKDPARRLRDLGDARLEIEEVQAELANGPPAAQLPAAPARRGRWLFAGAATLLAVGAFLFGWYVSRPAPTPSPAGEAPQAWWGEVLIGGTTRAFGPRLSPDGRTLAFIVLHKNNTQLAVMNVAAGAGAGQFRLLTHDHSSISNHCWSRDSSFLYYDRSYAEPRGIYRLSADQAPPAATDPPPLVPGAECPQVLSDETVLFTRINSEGNLEVCRYWPSGEKPPEQVLPHAIQRNTGIDEGWWARPIRPLNGRLQFLFCGQLLDPSDKAPVRRLYLYDLETKERKVLYEPVRHDLASLAVSRDDRFAYIVLPAGNAYQVTRIAIDGSAPPRTVLETTSPIYGLDVDAREDFYLDQMQRPVELLRFSPQGGAAGRIPAERVADLSRGPLMQPVDLPDGRLVLPSRALGRDRLLLADPRKDGVPLRPDRETRPPVALVPPDHLAFLDCTPREVHVVLASIQGNFAFTRRLKHLPTDELVSLAASPDGQALYFVRKKQVHRISTRDDGARPQPVTAGHAVAVHPNGKELVVQRFDGSGARLFRHVLASGKSEEIKIKGPLRLAPDPIGARSIAADGRLLVAATTPESWYWWTALLDPKTGQLTHVPVDFDGDIYPSNWSHDGKVLGLGYATRSEIWHFTRAKRPGEKGP